VLISQSKYSMEHGISLRVAHLSPSFLPIIGGTEIYISNLVSALGEKGVESEVIALCDSEKWIPSRSVKERLMGETRIIIWPSHRLVGKFALLASMLVRVHLFPSQVSRLREHLRNFDVLHFHDDLDLSFPMALLAVNKPRLFSCHSLWTTMRAPNLFAPKLLVKSADLFHVFSVADQKKLEGIGIPDRRIRVIPQGVNVSEFRPPESRPQRDNIRVVFVGRITRIKGLMTLLRAFALVNRSQAGHRVELLIAGPVWDQTCYKELDDYKREMQLQNVRFVGPVLPSNLPTFLRSADIFAFPSLMETFPIVVLEAMASGLPVVATPVGALREVVTENETGFRFQPRDYETMAEKLMLLSSDRRLRERIGRKARERVVRCYSSEKNALKILELYRELS